MQAAFHASSHHGRHQAPVVASTASDPPKISNVIAATMQSRRTTPCWYAAPIAMPIPMTVHKLPSM